jgi:cellulose synthase/poly-beta-1,6-N-acetylglucosamine synthase-like glycosyltransferase
MEITFWTCVSLIFYSWFIYPLILKLLNIFWCKNIKKELYSPSVTILLTVFNEERIIRNRLKNLLSLEYPKEKVEILVASDGSTDSTDEIVRKEFANKGIKLLSFNKRQGKSITQNEAIKFIDSKILAFTDADTIFDIKWLKKIVQPFADPSVGCVSGQLLLRKNYNSISDSQGLYWRFETVLRLMESRLGILSTASGQCMAIRRELFKPLDSRYGDDCVIPLDIILQGYRVVHEPEAIAYDAFPSSIRGELKTRARMTLRNWTGTLSRKQLLNPFKYPLISLSLISHKLLRWLTPYFLLGILLVNLFLLKNPLYRFLGVIQLAFYMLAFIGFILEMKKKNILIFTIPFSFCLGNIGIFIGVLRSFFGVKITTYK